MSNSSSDEMFINALRKIFGKRSIIFGEDPARYDELLVLVAADVRPRTMREWLVVKDIVDAQWEFWRIRGFKAGVLHAALPGVITKQMKAAAGKELTSKTTKFVREQLVRVLTGEEGAREAFASVLAEYQLTMDDLATVAFREQMQLQLEIDNRADAAHNRRNGAYAELEALREQILRADTPSLPMRYIEAPGSIAPTGAVDAAGRGPATDQTSTNTIPPHTEPARVSGDRVIDDDPDPS